MVLFDTVIGIFYQSDISFIKANYYRLDTRDKPSYYRLVCGHKASYIDKPPLTIQCQLQCNVVCN